MKTNKKVFLSTAALMLGAIGFAQNNYCYIDQNGETQLVKVTQTGSHIDSDVLQIGGFNTATVTQYRIYSESIVEHASSQHFKVKRNKSTIVQTGDNNYSLQEITRWSW